MKKIYAIMTHAFNGDFTNHFVSEAYTQYSYAEERKLALEKMHPFSRFSIHEIWLDQTED